MLFMQSLSINQSVGQSVDSDEKTNSLTPMTMTMTAGIFFSFSKFRSTVEHLNAEVKMYNNKSVSTDTAKSGV